MMSSSSGRSSGFPFTASQWQELEHQALVFKYMVSGMPIPPDLLFTIRRSLDSSLSSKFLIHQPQHIGWNSFQMGFGRKIDPEPGRCRRTDGKKWRCSKEAYPDSKYCERHMHRGRNRSRKPVEILSPTSATATAPPSSNSIPINNTSITNRNALHPPPPPPPPPPPFLTSSAAANTEPHFLYPPHFPSSRPPGFPLSSQESSNFFLDSNLHSPPPPKDCRNSSYGHGLKGESDEHTFFSSEADSNSGSMMRSLYGGNNSSPKLAPPITMASSKASQIKHNAYYSDFQKSIQSFDDHTTTYGRHNDDNDHHYYSCDRPLNLGIDHDQQPKKVMHHFLDEWPPKDKDSWTNSDDKMPSHRTQLSISIPNSLHDFFMTQKW